MGQVKYWELGYPESLKTPSTHRIRNTRIETIDMARGIAISLMFLSHCVKGLLSFQMMPQWGIVPIHLITKFSSSLFIMIFGMSLSLFFANTIETPKWPKKRKKLLIRGLEILFWYKVLTFVQMFQIYPEQVIIDTLLFKKFPDFVEVLGFYAICLMWIPFFLPFWRGLSTPFKFLVILLFGFIGTSLTQSDWGSYTSLKAILVEHKGYYTFGQFQRGAIVCMGLLLGDTLQSFKDRNRGQNYLSAILLLLSLCFFGFFYYISGENTDQFLQAIARNNGKHPPMAHFMSFSLGGAFGILSLLLFARNYLSKLFLPFTYIGRTPLFSFSYHIIVIFVFYRWIFDLRRNTTYEAALWLTLLLLISCSTISYMLCKRKDRK